MDFTSNPTAGRFVRERQQMVTQQLRDHGIEDKRVLAAMQAVHREDFVPAELRSSAYDDCPLPIGYDQTISQPFTVAFMCQALSLTGTERVLEIGTGSGYGAAVLSELCREVYTIERIPELADGAREHLARLGYARVHVVTGDGTIGLAEHAPYDAIVVTACAQSLPDAYVQQLAPSGRIVIPLGEHRLCQTMYRFTRLPNRLQVEDLGGFAFVPLIGRYGWQSSNSVPR